MALLIEKADTVDVSKVHIPQIKFTAVIEIPEAKIQRHTKKYNGCLDYLPLHGNFEEVSVIEIFTI